MRKRTETQFYSITGKKNRTNEQDKRGLKREKST